MQLARLNDALIFHLDLPDRLRPWPGETARRGYSGDELSHYFEMDKYLDDEDYERFRHDVVTALERDVQDLVRFVGVVARSHRHILRHENSNYYPGAKTICVSGLRRHYESASGAEDWLSANFAFANAFAADKELHGPRMYVDDNVLELLCIDPIARNLVRYASLIREDSHFDPMDDPIDGFYSPGSTVPAKPHRASLFRQPFYFREVDTIPLTHLQAVPPLRPFVTGELAAQGKSIFRFVQRRMQHGPDVSKVRSGAFEPHPPVPLDLTFRLHEYFEVIMTGKSESREQRRLDESTARFSAPEHKDS